MWAVLGHCVSVGVSWDKLLQHCLFSQWHYFILGQTVCGQQKYKTYAILGEKNQFICSKFHNSLISILCRLLISHFLC